MGLFSRDRYSDDSRGFGRHDRGDYDRGTYNNRTFTGNDRTGPGHLDNTYDGRGTLGDNRHGPGLVDNNRTGPGGLTNTQYGPNDRVNDRFDRTDYRGNDRFGNRGYNGPNDYDRRDYDGNEKLGHHDRYDDYDRRDRHSRGGMFSGFGGRNRHGDRHNRGPKQKRPLFDINSGNFNRRPSFGQWLKFTILDILTMIAMGAVGLGIYFADPAPSRSFPVTFSDSTIVYPQFAYPLRHEIVPIWEAALLAALVPIAVILLMQIRIKSFWDVNNAVIGLLYSLITAAVFQVWIKWLIGGLRPHFLTVCNPDLAQVLQGGDGFQSVMFDRSICRGNRQEINDSLESMPSGHSTAAWAGFLYLYFYLNAKLKIFANYHPAMWKLVAVYAPVLGACLITGSLTIDEYHNWYDCLAGAIIGSVMAISAYRMVYASVWDFRFNHIPLTRHTPFSYGAGEAGAGGFESAVFSRKAGWGFDEAYGGAPFDAARHLRGQAMGFNTQLIDTNKIDGHHSHGHGLGRGTTTTAATTHHKETDPLHRHDRVDRGRLDADGYVHDNAATTTVDRDLDRDHYHRDGDIERHAGTTTTHPTTGLTSGTHHNTTTTSPGTGLGSGTGIGTGTGPTHLTGTGNTHVPGSGHTPVTGTRDTHIPGTGPTTTHIPGTGPTNTHVSGPAPDYTTATGTGTDGLNRTTPSPNRYRAHRKSLERKAVPPNEQRPPNPIY